MREGLRAGVGAGAALAALGLAATAYAGGTSGGMKSGAGCNCTPPPPCNCTVPTGHDVNVPGVNITPPSITVNSPTINISAPTIDVQSSSVSYSSSSASSSASSDSSASANGSAQGTAAGYGYANALAAVNASGYGFGGGGSSYSLSEGGTSYIPALAVEGVEVAQARRICAQMRSVARVVAIQASCLDDKAVPHPASQVIPDRDILPTYEGELFRCIAGTRMQYTIADYSGQADFGRGQTVSCLKGEALYHSATGALACRAQKPARDCNERSLLRRFGAGIKVIKLGGAGQCVAYRTETAASTPAAGAMVLDGGVGGVVH